MQSLGGRWHHLAPLFDRRLLSQRRETTSGELMRHSNTFLANEIANTLSAAEMLSGLSSDAEVVILKTLNNHGVYHIERPLTIEGIDYHISCELSKEITLAVCMGVSRSKLADALGVGINSIIRWENGFSVPEKHIQMIFINEIRETVLKTGARYA